MNFKASLLCAGLLLANLTGASAQDVIADKLAFPESPLLVDGKIHWVEYAGNAVMRMDGDQKVTVHSQDGCGHNGLAKVSDNKLALVCYESGEILYIDYKGNVVERLSKDSNGVAFDHPNDIVIAADGGTYITTSGPFVEAPAIVGGVFYRAPGAETFTEVANDIHFSNGVAISNGGKTLLVGEHNTNRILKFDINEDGSLSNRDVFVRMVDLVQDGDKPSIWLGPDGMTVDKDGNIFVAHYLGHRVLKMSQDGTLMKIYDIPNGIGTTNVELDEANGHLYVTAAEDLVNAPYYGKLYRLSLD